MAKFKVIVNGYPANVSVRRGAFLSDVVYSAWDKTGNSGQPIDQWELRDVNGVPLPLHHRASTIANGATLFLNVRAGIGGSLVA